MGSVIPQGTLRSAVQTWRLRPQEQSWRTFHCGPVIDEHSVPIVAQSGLLVALCTAVEGLMKSKSAKGSHLPRHRPRNELARAIEQLGRHDINVSCFAIERLFI